VARKEKMGWWNKRENEERKIIIKNKIIIMRESIVSK